MLWRIRFDGGSFVDLPIGTSRLGRGEGCAVHVPHRSVSREHLLLHVGVDELTAEDLGSRNGTWLDRTRLRGRRLVRDAMELRVGQVSMILTPVIEAGASEPSGRCPACRQALAGGHCRGCAITQRLAPATRTSAAAALGALGPQDAFALHVELAHRALTAGRFEDARLAFVRLAEAPDVLDPGTPVLWNALLRCAVSLAVATEEPRWLQWVFERLAEAREPPLDVLQSVQQLPPSLLVSALPSLDRLLTRWRARGDELPRRVIESVPPLASLARELAPASAPAD